MIRKLASTATAPHFDSLQVTADGRGHAYGYQQYLHNLYLADGFR